MKRLSNEKGAVTIFLLLVFLGIFMFTALLVEGIRIRSAQAILERATDTSIRSTLAGFDAQLKEEYGLFAYDVDYAAEVSEGYVKANVDFVEDSSWNLYDFNVESVVPTEEHTLMNIDVFERQVLEYMKYRGLVSIGQEVFEKMQACLSLSKTAKLLQEDQEVDEKVAQTANTVKQLKGEVESHNGSYASKISSIEDLIKSYHEDYEKIEPLKDELVDVESDLGPLQRIPFADRSDADKSKINKLNDKKNELEGEIDVLEDAIEATKTAILQKINNQNMVLNRIRESAKKLEKQAQEASVAVSDAKVSINKSDAHCNDTIKENLNIKYEDYEDKLNPEEIKSVLSTVETNQSALKYLESIIDQTSKSPSNHAYTKISYIHASSDASSESSEDVEEPEDNGFNLSAFYELANELKDAFLGVPIEDPPLESDMIEALPSNVIGFGRGLGMVLVPGDQPVSHGTNSLSGDIRALINDYGSGGEDTGDYLKNASLGSDNPMANEFLDAKGMDNLGPRVRNALIMNEYIIMMFNHRVAQIEGRSAYFERTEIEYIIMGCEDPKDNALRVRLAIIGLRLVPNTIAVMQDTITEGIIEPIAMSAGAATGGIAYYPVKFGLILAIATAESAFDAYQLCDGYMIKLIKGPKDTIIGSGFKTLVMVMGDRLSGTNINIEDLKKATQSSSRDSAPSIPEKSSITIKKDKVPGLDLTKKEDLELAEKPEKDKQTPLIKVDYEDHLRFMLFMMDLTGNRDSKIRRVQDVVQINLGLNREGFTLEKVATFLRLKVNATIKSIFFGESAGDMTNSKDNAEYYKNRRDLEVEIMHGY